MAPVKYKCDSNELRGTFARSKNLLTKLTLNGPVVTPTPGQQICIIFCNSAYFALVCHDDIIKWKHFSRHRPFVRGIHRSPVNSPHKGQWRGALMFCNICAWINGWVNIHKVGDLRRHRAHYDVTVVINVERIIHDLCLNKRLSKVNNLDAGELVRHIRSLWRHVVGKWGSSCTAGLTLKRTTAKHNIIWDQILTHWGRNKMDAISQTTLSNAFSWMKMLEFRLRFQLSLFLRVQSTIIHHWFR